MVFPDRAASGRAKWVLAERRDMSDETEDAAYDPTSPTPPAREAARRSTAPQSEYTTGQVGLGAVILLVGLVVTVGLPLVLA